MPDLVDDYRDRYDDTIEALGTLTPAAARPAVLRSRNDEDIFAVNLVAGRTYTFEIQGASSGFTVADPYFYLRDSIGSAVGFSSGIGGGNTNDRLVFTAQTSGTFHVDAFSGGATGTYKVLADAGYVDDYRDVYDASIEALGSLTIGGSANGTSRSPPTRTSSRSVFVARPDLHLRNSGRVVRLHDRRSFVLPAQQCRFGGRIFVEYWRRKHQ